MKNFDTWALKLSSSTKRFFFLSESFLSCARLFLCCGVYNMQYLPIINVKIIPTWKFNFSSSQLFFCLSLPLIHEESFPLAIFFELLNKKLKTFLIIDTEISVWWEAKFYTDGKQLYRQFTSTNFCNLKAFIHRTSDLFPSDYAFLCYYFFSAECVWEISCLRVNQVLLNIT